MSMKRITVLWGAATGAERFVLAAAGLALASTFVLAAVALLKRPADITNPDVAFEARPEEPQPAGGNRRAAEEWVRYGYDLERTKNLRAMRVRPPFRPLWTYEQDQLIEFAPIAVGKRLYAIDNDGVVIALNADTGRVVWRKQYGRLNASSPAYEDGVLYAVNLQPGQALAIRARDGKLLWQRDLPSRSESSPIVVRGRMYFGTESGEFYALRARDGKVLWTRNLAGEVKAAPAFSDGTLYVGDYAGRFYALRATDGAERWQAADLGVGLGRSGRFYSTAAVAFGRVYAGNVDGRIYSFDQRTGEIAWTRSADHWIYSGVAAANTPGTRPTVYFGSHDRRVYALDARNGEVRWREEPGGPVSGPATVIGGIVYVSTFTGKATVGYDIRTGRRVFRYDDGEYGPVVSDGQRLYLTGSSSIHAFEPVDVDGRYNERPRTRGVIPRSELRRLRRERRGERADRRAERRQGAGGGQQGRRGDSAQGRDRPHRGGGGARTRRNR